MGFCPREKTRQQVTLDVLMNLDANILCLQELDNYDNFYKEKLWQYDYSSIYVKRGGMKKIRMWDLIKHNTLELDIEEKIDYNDLAELILDESTRVKLKEKALDSDYGIWYRVLYLNFCIFLDFGLSSIMLLDFGIGQGKNSQDHGDPDDPYVRLKHDCVAIMAAFKFKEPYEHYVIVANSHIYW
ncbi:DNAse I-like superfamily protein [Tanacetum coccineum]